MPLQYLDLDKLEAIDPQAFRTRSPYPWANPDGVLTAAGHAALLGQMPDISLFQQKFGYQRRAGQRPHDRYSLEYTEDTPVPEPWREFIGELRGDRYRNTISRLFDVRRPEFRFHWHYAPRGCSVSPHCDARREYGSHIFYFNGEGDWDPSWGGDTLVLDDGGAFDSHSAPGFDDFRQAIPCRSVGNSSMLFHNNGHAWHGVRELSCPEDRMRRVFIVVVNSSTLYWRVRDKLVGKAIQRF
jgi:hypothetical protein